MPVAEPARGLPLPARTRAHDDAALRAAGQQLADVGQLAVMPLTSLSLGMIPFTAQPTAWPVEAFYVHDDTLVVVETLTAES